MATILRPIALTLPALALAALMLLLATCVSIHDEMLWAAFGPINLAIWLG